MTRRTRRATTCAALGIVVAGAAIGFARTEPGAKLCLGFHVLGLEAFASQQAMDNYVHQMADDDYKARFGERAWAVAKAETEMRLASDQLGKLDAQAQRDLLQILTDDAAPSARTVASAR